MKSSATLSIGELAERFGLATSVLRHWEEVGVVVPAERVNGRRRYSPNDVVRVGAVLLYQQAGMSLPVIRELLADRRRPARHKLLAARLADVERQIGELEAVRVALEHGLRGEAPDQLECPVFRRMALG